MPFELLLVKGVWSELKSGLGGFCLNNNYILAMNKKNMVFEEKYSHVLTFGT